MSRLESTALLFATQRMSASLLERDTRGFTPTDAARSLLQLAEEIEEAAGKFAKKSQELNEPSTIRITAPGFFSDIVMDIFSDFSAVNPGIAFDFIPSVKVLDLSKGEADIAIRVTASEPDERLICRTIRTAKWALFGVKETPTSSACRNPHDLRDHRFVTFEHADVPDYLIVGCQNAYTPNLKPALKDPSEYRIIGQSKPRLDLPAKVDGSAQFGLDVVVPDMVYAAIALPPVRDARAAQIDQSDLKDHPGLGRVLNLGDVVAVTADSYWTASQALEELSIEWEGGQTDLSSASVAAQLDADLTDGAVEVMDGASDAAAAMGGSTALNAEYAVPYLAQCKMPAALLMRVKARRTTRLLP